MSTQTTTKNPNPNFNLFQTSTTAIHCKFTERKDLILVSVCIPIPRLTFKRYKLICLLWQLFFQGWTHGELPCEKDHVQGSCPATFDINCLCCWRISTFQLLQKCLELPTQTYPSEYKLLLCSLSKWRAPIYLHLYTSVSTGIINTEFSTICNIFYWRHYVTTAPLTYCFNK